MSEPRVDDDDDLTTLWSAFKDDGDARARAQLIERYWPLVRYVAKKISRTLSSQASLDDLEGYGAEGLIHAVDRFDVGRNVRFVTFAMHRIRGAIYDGLRTGDWAPRSLRRKERDIKETLTTLWNTHGRQPTEAEEADALGVPVAMLRTVKTAIASTRLSSVDMHDPEHEFALDSEVEQEPLQLYLEKERHQQVREAVGSLPDRERLAVMLSFGEGYTLAQIGVRLQVTESRVCQIRANGIRRLRKLLAEEPVPVLARQSA